MKNPPPTTINLAGRERTLCFDRHARFRYGQQGGNLNALLAIPGQDYFQSVILIWSALDEASRREFPSPDLLIDYIPEDEPEDAENPILKPTFIGAAGAGWFKLAEEKPGANAS